MSGDQLISVSPQGAMTSSTVSLPGFLGTHPGLLAIVGDRRGNLWATAGGSAGHAVLKLSAPGEVLEAIRIPALVGPGQGLEHTIVVAPNGEVWFVAGEAGGLIGTIDPATGRYRRFPISSQLRREGGAFAGGIAVGPDGNIWFPWTSGNGGETGPFDFGVARLTPSGLVTFFSAHQGGGVEALDIVSNAGRLWFTINAVPGNPQQGGELLSYSPPSRPCLVPRLTGRSTASAQHLLQARNCQLGQVTRPAHRRCPNARLVVTQQQPHAGSTQAGLTDVDVRLACRWR
ncbi:MAG: hypothetical protein M3065_22340 [Actinomycetota bacterium]|nr:hypothetical protein [Actinomycetota bacterium]